VFITLGLYKFIPSVVEGLARKPALSCSKAATIGRTGLASVFGKGTFIFTVTIKIS